uniref:Uncharacterized protein LOC111102349 isoform X2 n=1 Tax=Crassostrea virginica TaxID=6565 RepID=A0A8B8AL08_CRAVI|nr:uncharacterized protein LOC111102349 isoform X2 [Crassostrea virginica]
MDEKNTHDKKYHKQHIRRLAARKMAILAKRKSDTCSTLDKKDEHDDESTRNDDETTRSDDKTRSDDETTKSDDEITFALQEHKHFLIDSSFNKHYDQRFFHNDRRAYDFL